MSAAGKDRGAVGFTPAQLRKLNRPVRGRHLHTREVDGRRLTYIEGWYAISLANEIFGFAGWDRATLHLERVHEKYRQDQIVCGYLARVRITVRASGAEIVREGTGWGWATSRTAGLAHERAMKAAETDATKRALQTFGPQFGLTLYDKETPCPTRGVPLFAPDGSSLSDDLSPEGFSSGLRQLIERCTSAAEIKQLTKFNEGSIAEIRTLAPALRNIEGTHFADLLLRLIEVGKKRVPQESVCRADYPPTAPNNDASSSHVTPGPSRIGDGPKIDKSELILGSEKRIRDKEHLRGVAELPCLICGRQPSHAHHLKFAQRRGLSQKVSDQYVVPLCALHHGDLHRASKEKEWWHSQRIDPLPIANELWAQRLAKVPFDTTESAQV